LDCLKSLSSGFKANTRGSQLALSVDGHLLPEWEARRTRDSIVKTHHDRYP